MANEVSDESALHIPAPYTNRIQVLVAGSNIRVAFGEGLPDGSNVFRSAVVMSSSDALELVDYLLQAIKAVQPSQSPPMGLFGGIGMAGTEPYNALAGGFLSGHKKNV
jgi:hypothetical protein